MKGALKLNKNKDFKKVYNEGKFISEMYVVVYFRENEMDSTRIGFTASKKIGKSVARNRARRLMKESLRTIEGNLKKGYDIVFVARPTINEGNFHQVKESIERILKKARLLEN